MVQIPAVSNPTARTLLRGVSSPSEKKYELTSPMGGAVVIIIRVTQILFTVLCFSQQGITKMSIFSVTAFLGITEIFRKAPYDQQKKIALLTDIFANGVKVFTSITERNNRTITTAAAHFGAAPARAARARSAGAAARSAAAHFSARVRDDGAIHSAEGERLNAIETVQLHESYFRRPERLDSMAAAAYPAPLPTAGARVDTTYYPQD